MRSVGASTPPLCSSERTRIALLILPRDMKSLKILRLECCFLFLKFILIWIAFASQNSSEKSQLCHARSLRWMVLLFDQSSVFFVRLRVKCGSITQRVRDIGSIRVYGNRGEDTVKGVSELFPCLVLTEREKRGLPCEELAVYFAHCYRVKRLEVIPKIIRWSGDGTFGGVRCCRIYESSVGNGQIIVWCRRCDCCFGGCGDLRVAFAAEVFGPLSLRLGHCILRENIYNTYDTIRLPYVGDPCRVGLSYADFSLDGFCAFVLEHSLTA